MTVNDPLAGISGQVDPTKLADAIGMLLQSMPDQPNGASALLGQSLTDSTPLRTPDDFLKSMQGLLTTGTKGKVSTQGAIDTAVARFTGALTGQDPGSENQPLPAPTATSTTTAGAPSQNVPGGENGGQASSSGDWVKDILKGIGAPDTPQNEQVLNAWIRAEGGVDHNNALNTTQKEPGSTDWNYNGGYPVQAYGDYQTGLKATLSTLLQDNMSGIVKALRAGNNPMAVAQAIADSGWGTGDLVKQIIGGQ